MGSMYSSGNTTPEASPVAVDVPVPAPGVEHAMKTRDAFGALLMESDGRIIDAIQETMRTVSEDGVPHVGILISVEDDGGSMCLEGLTADELTSNPIFKEMREKHAKRSDEIPIFLQVSIPGTPMSLSAVYFCKRLS
jgi:hypothetical protein